MEKHSSSAQNPAGVAELHQQRGYKNMKSTTQRGHLEHTGGRNTLGSHDRKREKGCYHETEPFEIDLGYQAGRTKCWGVEGADLRRRDGLDQNMEEGRHGAESLLCLDGVLGSDERLKPKE